MQHIIVRYNTIKKEGVVPAVWKQANVVPIPKTHPPPSSCIVALASNFANIFFV